MFIPLWQSGAPAAYIAVRTSSNSIYFIPSLRSALQRVDPVLGIADVRTMAQLLDAATMRRRFLTTVLALFAVAATFLGMVGLYGLTSYLVAQRKVEIGIRVALGASRTRIWGLVVGEGLRLAAVGLVIGVASAFVLGRLIAGSLFEISVYDPFNLFVICGLVIVVSTLATLLPAWRAMRMDAAISLRNE